MSANPETPIKAIGINWILKEGADQNEKYNVPLFQAYAESFVARYNAYPQLIEDKKRLMEALRAQYLGEDREVAGKVLRELNELETR